jgi:hypothetical protein
MSVCGDLAPPWHDAPMAGLERGSRSAIFAIGTKVAQS